MDLKHKSLEETINLNKEQAQYYDKAKSKNIPTKIWSYLRENTLRSIRQEIGVENDCYNQHEIWFGDLSNKKVLDLGCGAGNVHSLTLAKNSKKYFGVDLSKKSIEKLNIKLKDFPNAKAMTIDFLSEDFKERDFDLIYAYGVLHHFENLDLLIRRLKDVLKVNGEIISHDPLETSLPIFLLRRLYRPFQSDALWEWPFNKKTINKFDYDFDILDRRGILGKAKWYFLIALLPIPSSNKKKIGKYLKNLDWEKSAMSNRHLYNCMQVSFHMKNR